MRKRYHYLWTGEATAVILFSLLFLWYAGQDGQWHAWIVRTYSLGVVITILIQGVVWWRWKLRLLDQGTRTMPPPVLRAYCFWRDMNWILIGAFPLIVVSVALWFNRLLSSPDACWGLLMLVGALLEQINYYYYQLMYDSAYDWAYLWRHRRLRRGTIAKAVLRSTNTGS